MQSLPKNSLRFALHVMKGFNFRHLIRKGRFYRPSVLLHFELPRLEENILIKNHTLRVFVDLISASMSRGSPLSVLKCLVVARQIPASLEAAASFTHHSSSHEHHGGFEGLFLLQKSWAEQ